MSQVIDFYSDNSRIAFNFCSFDPNKRYTPYKWIGKYSDLVEELSNFQQEYSHDYIQWLFPLPEHSKFNENSPLLTQEDIAIIHNSFYLKKKIYSSFQMMAKFYGFNLVKDKIHPPTDKWIQDRIAFDRPIWLTKNNHNLLRITRILRCLALCGLKDVSSNFLRALTKLALRYPEIITEEVWNYWEAASRGELYVPCHITNSSVS